MEFYEVLEKRRTIRDFSGREVSDELLRKVLGAAFKVPTNDHLRQFEFVVVSGRESIARLVAPVAGNTSAIQDPYIAKEEGSMDEDEYAMFVDALPKQQRMLLESGCVVLPFFRQKDCPLCQPEFPQLLCLCLGCCGKHPPGSHSGRSCLCLPHPHCRRGRTCEKACACA